MRSAIGLLSGVVLAAAAAPALALEIGDKAPPIDVSDWIQGGPVKLEDAAGKSIVVVEFWATWCGPCKVSIPHLSKLSERFKGQVQFVGVSNEDAATVKEFAKDGKFKYAVAADTNKNTWGPYMEGVEGIPHAVVVDKQGNVAWMGHPMGGLDAVLEKLVAGKYDTAKAKQAADLRKDMIKEVQTQDADKILAATDKVLETAPDDELAMNLRYQCYVKKEDPAAWKTFVQGHVAKLEGDWRALNSLAWRLCTIDDLKWREPAVAMKAAKRAVELSQSKESPALDTCARVLFESGMLDQAIDLQKKAVALDAEDKDLKATLDYYTSCADVRKAAGGATPPKKK